MLVCWAGMALAVLAKGLIGLVLPGGVLVFYTMFARDWNIWTRLHLGKGLLLFLAIAAPWFVLVGLANPEQPHFFFIHEHFDRFLLKEHHREAAWWYFFALLAAGSVPWIGVLVQSLLLGARRERGASFQPKILLLAWIVLIVLFFTKSSSKLPGYILPVFPAVALLVAMYLEAGTRRGRIATAALTALLGVALMSFVPFMPRLAKHAGEAMMFQSYQPWVLAAGFVAAAGGGLAMLYARQMQRDLMVIALALAGFGATELMLSGFEPIAKARAGTNLLPAIEREITPATKLYSVGIYEQSLTFYLRRPVTLVDYTDEFAFGLQQEPQLSIPTQAAFNEQWTREAKQGVHALAIIRADIATSMQQQGLPVRIVAQDARRTVIANY
jgi:4-amino-4-deoxy-L-arabinose transferase-like glycosyltransferase